MSIPNTPESSVISFSRERIAEYVGLADAWLTVRFILDMIFCLPCIN